MVAWEIRFASSGVVVVELFSRLSQTIDGYY
jgi:hypothetical protein